MEHELFDRLFKELLRLSDTAVINFINGLFGEDHPLSSTVERSNTEFIKANGEKIVGDMILVIGGAYSYLIETQIADDKSMAVRVFEYGFLQGKYKLNYRNNRIILRFPKARVIYWEPSARTPDFLQLQLEFPDGSFYNYRVETFKVPNFTVEELEARKLSLLLPYYPLGLRRKFQKAKSGEARQKLFAELAHQEKAIMAAINRAERTGVMTRTDSNAVTEYTKRLQGTVYPEYSGLKEANGMFDPAEVRIRWQEAERQILEAQQQRQEAVQQKQEAQQQWQEAIQQRQEVERKLREVERQRIQLEQKLRDHGINP
jgi:hypothetical protein